MFNQDEAGFAIDDQFYVGSSGLLVKPVTAEGVTETSVYIGEDQVTHFSQLFLDHDPLTHTHCSRYTTTTSRMKFIKAPGKADMSAYLLLCIRFLSWSVVALLFPCENAHAARVH
jgi:hypothetical protein